ncbi:hypothetical protein MMC12_006943 [Toensbergia leucococca]|nr:hypothetical protein [Toensbergia leucococca]
MADRMDYNSIEDDEYEHVERDAWSKERESPNLDTVGGLHGPDEFGGGGVGDQDDICMPRPLRTVSREGSLRHPTPDLQSLQGAYVGNVERLEQSAERLSMSSDIGEEVRKLRMEQKRSDSRKSSILQAHAEEAETSPVTRQFSYASNASNSILGLNSVARSGGFSPSGYFTSPRGSIRSGSWSQSSIKGRSVSQIQRLTQMPEPEKEGKPLDSPISARSVPVLPSLKSNVLRVMNQNGSSSSPSIHSAEQAVNSHSPEPVRAEELGSPGDQPDRPTTAASTDTSQRATSLFADFDGVHITPLQHPSTRDEPESCQESLNQPPFAERPLSYVDRSRENMVYYPAPVPMMLNLPQKLSKLPSATRRDKRRSQMLAAVPADARKSAAWLPNVLEAGNEDIEQQHNSIPLLGKTDNRRSMADLPPQLRASVFFDYPSIQQDLEVKGDSAVATLDSILDASAHAPVSAFTDHPYAGHVGAEVYGRTSKASPDKAEHRKSRSSMIFLSDRKSNSVILEDTKKRNSSLLSLGTQLGRRKSSVPQPGDLQYSTEGKAAAIHDEDVQQHESDEEHTHGRGEGEQDLNFHDAPEDFKGEEEGEELEQEGEYSGQPTTLLAELQLRKQEQKTRNRTAATAFPDGMHSTLLELDAVAQIQKQSRKQKHITLAWEDPDAHHPGAENQDDEDVPLGMLFPGRKVATYESRGRFHDDMPLGLIARREMEDNEPLSRRRARLRGDPPPARNPSPGKQESMYTLEVPGLTDAKAPEPADLEGETLGQRLKRLTKGQAAHSQPTPLSGDFASELLSQFEPPLDTSIPAPTQTPDPDPEEETLAQRRKRLQASRDASGSSADPPPLTQRRSLADLLHAHPTASAPGSRSTSHELPLPATTKSRFTAGGLLHQNQQLQAQRQQQLWEQNRVGSMDANGMRSGVVGSRVMLPMVSGIGVPLPGGVPIGVGLQGGVGYGGLELGGGFGGMGKEEVDLGEGGRKDMVDRWRWSVGR